MCCITEIFENIQTGPRGVANREHEQVTLMVPATSNMFESKQTLSKPVNDTPKLGMIGKQNNLAPVEPSFVPPVPPSPPPTQPKEGVVNMSSTLKPKQLVRLIANCLMTDPASRPEVVTVLKKMTSFAGGKSWSVAGNLIRRMTKYADELEATVEQRTHELRVEQHKTEALLFEILPRY